MNVSREEQWPNYVCEKRSIVIIDQLSLEVGWEGD
jgi:hypothetical protein